MDAFYRNYLVKENHPIDDEILERALESMEGAALKFSADAISDAAQRENYNRNMKRVKAEVLAQVNAGKISVKEAAEFCYEARNKIMAEIRGKTSVHGRAMVEKKKKAPKAIEALLDEKSIKAFGKQFLELETGQRGAIHYEIVESSARPNTHYNTRNEVLKVVGKVLIVVTVAYAVYDVVNADNKYKEGVKQGSVIGGGIIGSLMGGALGGMACGPGAPVCSIALILVGSLSLGWFASALSKHYDEEIEEFTRWGIK